jgi:protease I
MTLDPRSSTPLSGMRVAVLVAEGVEDLEYWVTVMRLREAGAMVTSVGMTLDTVQGKNGLAARADVLATEADASGFDGLVIPGGWLPDKLRRYDAVTKLVRAIHDAGRPIGIICHGGSVAISAGIIQAGHSHGAASSTTSRTSSANSSRCSRSTTRPSPPAEPRRPSLGGTSVPIGQDDRAG